MIRVFSDGGLEGESRGGGCDGGGREAGRADAGAEPIDGVRCGGGVSDPRCVGASASVRSDVGEGVWFGGGGSETCFA